MGKKRVIEKSGEELLKERQAVQEGGQKKATKVSAKRKIAEARLHILSSYNNTIVTVSDVSGDVVAIVSAGALGFKGARKSTPFAASKVIATVVQLLESRGVERVRIFVRGIGPGRDSALRSLANRQVDILSIQDITPVPHNGPRPKKVRRV